jgi:hypothetical protein
MRGTVAKAIRRYVRETYPFLSEKPLHIRLPNGQIKLAPQCQRERVQELKRLYRQQLRTA